MMNCVGISDAYNFPYDDYTIIHRLRQTTGEEVVVLYESNPIQHHKFLPVTDYHRNAALKNSSCMDCVEN